MTTNIFSVMNTAKVGLLSQQLAIEVTGQNVANVQTEGYTRQEVSFEATPPRSIGLGLLGTGVKVASIKRASDQFLFNQILGEETPLGNYSVRKDVFDQMETLLNDSSGRSLNSSMSDFFSSLQDLSTNPSGLPERSALLARGQDLISSFKQVGDRLFQSQMDLDSSVSTKISEINDLTSEIARLNKVIHGSEPGAISANDLRDQRDKLIRQLAQGIDVTVVDETNGQINLTLKNGKALVLGSTSFNLSAKLNGDNNGFNDVQLDDGAGNKTNITSVIQGGKLRGYLDMRDTEIANLRDKLDRLAAGFAREMNRVHQQGIGLDGSTGLNFFKALAPVVKTNTNNAGSASVSVTNASPATASVDKYEITFTGANAFSLKNLTTGLASGTFTFASGSAFNLANGLAVTIAGSAAVGDKFRFSVSENASSSLALGAEIQADSRKIAAGKGTANDGQNALDMAALQRTLIFDGTTLTRAGSGTFTFDEFYNSVVSGLGVSSRTAQNTVTQQDGILTQLNNRRETVSGVSLDEEMINMIKFQQAYSASARVLNVVNSLFDTLQNKI